MSQHRRAAFTLIELLVVVSIMGLTLSVVTINYFRALQKQTLFDTGSKIEALLRDAQNKAQTGYLGNEEVGYCNQLQAVQVKATTVSGVTTFSESLLCQTNGPFLLNSVTIASTYSLSSAPTIQYLTQGGANLGGSDQITFTLSLNSEHLVVYTLNRGGAITVEYKSL